MRPGVVLAAAWVLATAVAVAVAVQGVGFVGREVTDQRPRALSVDQVREALRAGEAAAPATSTTSSSTTTVPSPSPSLTPPTTARPPAGTPAAPRASSGAGSPPPTVTSVATTRTYTLVGGSASIRFEPGKVTVQWATPNSGYEVDVETYAADRVEVRFRSEVHESELTAWWDGGPRDQVDEEDRSSGSGSEAD